MESLSQLRDILVTASIDVTIGAVTILAYLLTHVVKSKVNKINLANSITVFSSGFSLLPGLSVLLAGFESATPAKGIEQSYFFLGGFAVMYVGVQEIYNKFRAII